MTVSREQCQTLHEARPVAGLGGRDLIDTNYKLTA